MLNKIYLEVCIPKIFIDSGLTLSVMNKKETDEVKVLNIPAIEKEMSNVSNANTKENSINFNYNHKCYSETASVNSDHVYRPQVMNMPKYCSKPNSPVNTYRNGLGIKLPTNIRSPDFMKKSMNNMYNPYTSPIHNSYNNMHMMHQNLNTGNIRRMSDNLFDKMKENPLQKMNINMGSTMGMRSPPMYMKVNPDLMFGGNNMNLNNTQNVPQNMNKFNNVPNSKFNQSFNNKFSNFNLNGLNSDNEPMEYSNLVSNGFVSPRGYYNQVLNGNIVPNNTVPKNIISTIKRKHEPPEEESKQYKRNSQKTVNNINTNILQTQFDGLCNFILFVKASTPQIKIKDSKLMVRFKFNPKREMKLIDFFSNFEKISTFGLDLNYNLDNEIVLTSYSLTLSSIEIVVSDFDSYTSIMSELKKTKPDIEINETVDYYIDEGMTVKLLIGQDSIKIEFFENRPPHSRQIFISQIEQIINSFEVLRNITLNKIGNQSWFTVLFTPFKCSKSILMNSSFLVYYQFNLDEMALENNNSDFTEVPIIGILPIKFENKVFLQLINKNTQMNVNINYNMNMNNNNYMILKNLMDNVHNFVMINSKKSSVDYEFFLKNSTNILTY